MKLKVMLALAVPALFSANVAFGQGDEYQVAGQEDASYSVVFLDDLLKGDGIDSSAAQIKVRPPSTRSLLIRPRTSFVMEMFKSVENI
jgi:hypothetical protein